MATTLAALLGETYAPTPASGKPVGAILGQPAAKQPAATTKKKKE